MAQSPVAAGSLHRLRVWVLVAVGATRFEIGLGWYLQEHPLREDLQKIPQCCREFIELHLGYCQPFMIRSAGEECEFLTGERERVA